MTVGVILFRAPLVGTVGEVVLTFRPKSPDYY